MNHSRDLSLSIAALLFSIALFFPTASHAQSATSTDSMLTGYAWSSNIGWISFNCSNAGSCLSNEEYKVEILPSGALTGYAWSSNIGWIQFGGLSGFPSGNGTIAENAVVSNGSLRGWARALNAGGGWDGWISLSGSTVASPVNYSNAPISIDGSGYVPGAQGSYGATDNGSTITGYAWGSDVVGWLSFSTGESATNIVPNDPSTDPTAAGESCTGPDGYLISDGTSRTYYDQSSVVASGTESSCQSESRMCIKGVLGGDASYQYPSCSLLGATGMLRGGAPKVTLSIGEDGGNFTHGPLLVSNGSKVSVKWDTSAGGTPDSCVGSAGLLNATISPLSAGTVSLGSLSTSGTYTLTCVNSSGVATDTVRAVILNENEF